MYNYRKMSSDEKELILKERRNRGFPLHAPPHSIGITGAYLVTSTCFEHRPIFDHPEDLSWLAEEALRDFTNASCSLQGWVFLPNHYHILIQTEDLKIVSEIIRLLHSRTATEINSRHGTRGRTVWYRFSDRFIRSDGHYFASLNYIHYNPVKHNYVDSITDWPWSSIHEHMKTKGREWIKHIWKEYPLGDYGKGWDWQLRL